MAKTVLGKVSVTPRGEYDPAAQYEPLDAVRYQGCGYLVCRSCRGIPPAEGIYIENVRVLPDISYNHKYI